MKQFRPTRLLVPLLVLPLTSVLSVHASPYDMGEVTAEDLDDEPAGDSAEPRLYFADLVHAIDLFLNQ